MSGPPKITAAQLRARGVTPARALRRRQRKYGNLSGKPGKGQSLFTQAVKRVINGTTETKYVSEPVRALTGLSSLGTWGGFSSAITGTGEIYAALPRVGQGIDDHQRIGNTIKPKSVHVKLDVCTKVWNDNSSQDRTVHIFFLTATSVKSLDNYSAIPITQLLNKGDGTNVSFDGTPFTAQYPVNTSEFRVLHHTATRMVSGFGQSKGTTAATAGTTDGVISPAHSYAHLDYRIKVPKTFKFDRASQVYPTNSAPFMVIGFTDNNTVPSAPMDYVQVLGQVSMSYKDA